MLLFSHEKGKMHLEIHTAVKIMPLFSIRLLSHFNLSVAVDIYIIELQRRHLYPRTTA